MPSQQLPKSVKVDTLPPDLKKIADKMLRERFKIKEPKSELEVLTKMAPDTETFKRYTYELRVVDYDRQYYEPYQFRGLGGSGLGAGFVEPPRPPRTLDIVVGPLDDPMDIAEKINRNIQDIERRYRVKIEARRIV